MTSRGSGPGGKVRATRWRHSRRGDLALTIPGRVFLPHGTTTFTATAHATATDQVGHEGRPAGLVAGAEASTVVAVEVFVEEEVIAPVGVRLEQVVAAEDRATAALGLVAEEEAG